MQESTAAEPEVPSGDNDVAALIQEIGESVAAWSLTARPQRAESRGNESESAQALPTNKIVCAATAGVAAGQSDKPLRSAKTVAERTAKL
jgi:hypothetical protein